MSVRRLLHGRPTGEDGEKQTTGLPLELSADRTDSHCQGPGTVPSLDPHLSHPNPAGYAFVSDSHLPDGETEAWKGGVAPWAKSALPLSGKDHTSREGQHSAGIGGWRGCPVSRQDPQSSERREQSRGMIAKASWRKQHLITSPPDLDSPCQ